MLENNDIENISVSIGDIVEELSNLTEIDKDKIGISTRSEIGYWGIYNLDYLAFLIDLKDQKLGYYKYNKDKYFSINIYAEKALYDYDKKRKFNFNLKLKLDLNEIQADGKTLLAHSREQLYFDDGRESHYTGIVIDKDIENLNYKVNLEELENIIDSKDFYPSELFKQAIINIIESKNNNKQKVLK